MTSNLLADLCQRFRESHYYYGASAKLSVAFDIANPHIGTGSILPYPKIDLGKIAVNRSAVIVEYVSVQIISDHGPWDSTENGVAELGDLASQAGKILPLTEYEFVGVPVIKDAPALCWLAYVLLNMRQQRPEFMYATNQTHELYGHFHRETLIRPFLASAVAIELAGLNGERRASNVRKHRPSLKPKRPTDRQIEVMQIVGECKGNVAEAARRMKLDRKTVEQHYKAGLKKTGGLLLQKAMTKQLATDQRGQVNIAANSDGLASSLSTKIDRDRRRQ